MAASESSEESDAPPQPATSSAARTRRRTGNGVGARSCETPYCRLGFGRIAHSRPDRWSCRDARGSARLASLRRRAIPGRDRSPRPGARAAGAARDEPRPAGVRAGQPARDGQGRAVRALLALPGHAAAPVPRRVRRLAARRPAPPWDAGEGEGSRAAELYERIFVGYGDDSVAQLGGAHVACEWVSNVLTKVLQRPRLGAYLEQSTRYIAYDAPMPGGGYRYYRDPSLGAGVRARDGRALRDLRRSLPRVVAWVDEAFPAPDGEPSAAHRRAVAGQGARPAARPAARRVAVAHGDLRDRPDLRAAHPAPAGAPAARGAPLRRDAPRGACRR